MNRDSILKKFFLVILASFSLSSVQSNAQNSSNFDESLIGLQSNELICGIDTIKINFKSADEIEYRIIRPNYNGVNSKIHVGRAYRDWEETKGYLFSYHDQYENVGIFIDPKNIIELWDSTYEVVAELQVKPKVYIEVGSYKYICEK